MQNNRQFNTAIHICIFMHFKGEDLISSQVIADSVKTNPVVIRRIIGKLKNKGIISSVAGTKGGFYLSRPAREISLWDIYTAVREQDLFYRQKKVNPECVVSSHLGLLVNDIYDAAELSTKTVLEKVNILQLTDKLGEIVNLDVNKFH